VERDYILGYMITELRHYKTEVRAKQERLQGPVEGVGSGGGGGDQSLGDLIRILKRRRILVRQQIESMNVFQRHRRTMSASVGSGGGGGVATTTTADPNAASPQLRRQRARQQIIVQSHSDPDLPTIAAATAAVDEQQRQSQRDWDITLLASDPVYTRARQEAARAEQMIRAGINPKKASKKRRKSSDILVATSASSAPALSTSTPARQRGYSLTVRRKKSKKE
jgi:hypothetical protein